ncbi:hypothetical protein H6796_00735 [Candidatus Nomurabacteria bacterium]|nr:hypothetical protein [Candidatus Nomurabacteria bacterium]
MTGSELSRYDAVSSDLMTTDKALSIVASEASGMSNKEKQRITERRVKALEAFVTQGLVQTEDDVASALDLFTHYDAHPNKISQLLSSYPEFTVHTVAQIYEARDSLAVNGSIKGLAELTDTLGGDVVSDHDFLEGLDLLTRELADALYTARKRQHNYADRSDQKGRVKGIAFRMAVSKVLEAYEDGLDIYDLIEVDDKHSDAISDDYSEEASA